MSATSRPVVETRLRYAFARMRVIVEELTDDEYFWEPVDRCWSIRRAADVDRGWGLGDWRCEDAFPAPEPLPLTTIGWRVVHLAAWTDVYRSFAFEDGSETLMGVVVPGTATNAVASLES